MFATHFFSIHRALTYLYEKDQAKTQCTKDKKNQFIKKKTKGPANTQKQCAHNASELQRAHFSAADWQRVDRVMGLSG